MSRVLVVGSAEQSAGGVASVIRLMKQMPVWKEYDCFWLGTQIQRNYAWKLWYAVRGNLLALCGMWRYDIVHIHTTPDKLGLLIQLPILLWARLWKRKVLMHLHVGNQLKTKRNRLFVFCLRHSDCILLLARKWQRLFAEYYPEVSVPTRVLYNPVSPCGLMPVKREKLILMAAWMNENKAPDVLLRAIKMLRDKPDGVGRDLDGWRVALLGNGEVERYRRMSEEMGLDDVVSFPGYVVGREREDYFSKASIYCMCSYEEGFPMVVLESWMYGISVVTTPVGGLPDVLEDGRNALVFDFGNSEMLALHLMRLMKDDQLRENLATHARQMAEQFFSPARIDADLRSVYESL